ncbi:MAG TPA: hypothetical protein VM840_11055 [Actinomycetota bacterium]|nr:hypothetical protein [Actinomycetota bacterium]
MSRSPRRPRPAPALKVGLLVLLLAAYAPPTASSQVPYAEAVFSGYSTGTAIHADALQSGTVRVANVDVSFSGAAVDSTGLSGPILNEMQRPVVPAVEADSYGRGSALEVGVAQAPDAGSPTLSVLARAEASAPPSTDVVTREAGPVDADPLAWVSAARGQAQARWEPDALCVIGAPYSYGLGYVADAQLVDTGQETAAEGLDSPLLAADAPDPARAVTRSMSRTMFTRQVSQAGAELGSALGLISETRQTIAPVTLFRGGTNEVTIELLGEWVLQAVATGVSGGAYVQYGPDAENPETIVVRILRAGAPALELAAQDVLDDDGLVVPIPGVGEIVIGEPPRAIGGATGSAPTVAADGTEVAAAVDVARIRLLEQRNAEGQISQRAANIRLGHMEVSSTVPVGGIECELPVTKTSDVPTINVGQTFVTTIPVTNPFDCVLEDVVVTDEIGTEGAARFEVTETDPPADDVPEGSELDVGVVTWNDIGPIEPGETVEVTVTLLAQGGVGTIFDTASVTATFGDCAAEGTSVGGVDVSPTGVGTQGTSEEVRVEVEEPVETPPLDVTKTVDPGTVTIGGAFTVTIEVTNDFDCTIEELTISDAITTTGDARFRVDSTEPEADEVPDGENLSDATIVWEGLGPIEPGGSLAVTAVFTAQGGRGEISDLATATATLADCEGEDAAREGVGVAGTAQQAVLAQAVDPEPEPTPQPTQPGAVLGLTLPRTGPVALGTTLQGLGMLALGMAGLRARRRMR